MGKFAIFGCHFCSFFIIDKSKKPQSSRTVYKVELKNSNDTSLSKAKNSTEPLICVLLCGGIFVLISRSLFVNFWGILFVVNC